MSKGSSAVPKDSEGDPHQEGEGAPPLLEIRAITKVFPGVIANDGVDLDLMPGEVHALLGENGAGKSTLASILTGLYRPDSGQIRLRGQPVEFRSPRQAVDAGVFMVHQHFRLVPSLTVADNVLLGHPAEPWMSGARGEMDERIAEVGRRHGLDVDLRARVGDLALGQRQRVEVLKALFRDPAVLILDEPTALLTPQEADALLQTLRQASRADRAILLISHRLNEVLAVADRVTVLRRGRAVATLAARDCDPRSLARTMIGRDLPEPPPRPPAAPARRDATPVLELRGVSAGDGSGRLRNVSLQVAAGEILGVAGVSGNGQRLLAEVIAGTARPATGEVLVDGRRTSGRGARGALRAGVAYVPEDRLGEAVAPGLSVAENLVLRTRAWHAFSRLGLLSRRRVERHARRLIGEYAIAATGPGAPVRVLSGGNIQKTVIARELANRPRLIVAVSPSQGLDVGATRFVREAIRGVATGGGAVVLISDDLDEILELADRIAVLYRGAIAGEMPRRETEAEKLGLLMLGAGA